MCGFGVIDQMRAEPWEADGDATTDGLAVFEPAFGVHEKDGLFANGLEVRDMCPVEINARGGQRAGDFDTGEIILAGGELDDTIDAELSVEFFVEFLDAHV